MQIYSPNGKFYIDQPHNIADPGHVPNINYAANRVISNASTGNPKGLCDYLRKQTPDKLDWLVELANGALDSLSDDDAQGLLHCLQLVSAAT